MCISFTSAVTHTHTYIHTHINTYKHIQTHIYRNTALHYAALREQGDIMRFLLSKKDENRREVKEILEWKNQLGMTILHDVCYIESKDMAMMLLEYGANINIKDNAGRTCLDLLGTKPRTTMNADGKARYDT